MTLIECLAGVTPPTIRQRGADYIKQVGGMLGGISGVTAEVRGSEDYDVNIRLAADELLVSCTCPYFFDRGAVCKHLWAVALAATGRGWLSNLPNTLPVIIDLDGEVFDDDLMDKFPSIPISVGRPSSRSATARCLGSRGVSTWRLRVDATRAIRWQVGWCVRATVCRWHSARC